MLIRFVKYTSPTKHDIAPYRAIWERINDGKIIEYWVQTSKNEDKPEWMTVGAFLERSFQNIWSDEQNIEEYWRIFEEKK